MSILLQLPPELWTHIFSSADTPNSARLVCRQWRVLIQPNKHSQDGYFANLTLFKWYIQQSQVMLSEKLMNKCARLGKLKLVKWLRGNDCSWDRWTCASAAGNGHLEILQWARDHRCPWDENTCCYAARGGHFAYLEVGERKWLSMG